MATYSKILLSGSTNGKPILITAAGSPGTLVHTGISGTSDNDEVWLYAQNVTETDIELSVEWGDTVDHIIGNILSKSGLILVVPGLLIQNSLAIRAYGDTASGIYIHGFVNRIEA